MIHRSTTRTVDRLAQRIVREHRTVSLCAVGVVAVSVGIASVLVTRATTPLVDATKATATQWGIANAVVFADAGSAHNFGGRPPEQPGSCCSTTVRTVEQLRAESNFPPGAPTLPIESFGVVLARSGAEDRGVALPVVQADLSDPLAVGMTRVIDGRLPSAPGEVALLRTPYSEVPSGPDDSAAAPPVDGTSVSAAQLSDVSDGRLGGTIEALAPPRRLTIVGEVVAPVAGVVAGGPAEILVAPGTFPPTTDPIWDGWQQGRTSWNGVILASLERPSSWSLTSRWGAIRDDDAVGASVPQVLDNRNPAGVSALMAAIAVLWALAVAGAVASALLGQHRRDLAQVHLAGGTEYVISRLGTRIMRPFVWGGTLIGGIVGFAVGLVTVDPMDPLLEPAHRWLTPLLSVVGLAFCVALCSGMVLSGVVARARVPTAAELLSGPTADHLARIPRQRRGWILIGSFAVCGLLLFVFVGRGSTRGLGHLASLAVPFTLLVTAVASVVGARFLLVGVAGSTSAFSRRPVWRMAARELADSVQRVTVAWVAVSLAIVLALFSVTVWESDRDRDERLQNDAAARSAAAASGEASNAPWATRQVVTPGNALTVRNGSVQPYVPADLQQRAFDAGFDFVRLSVDPHLCMANLSRVTNLGLTGPCAPASSVTVVADDAIDRMPTGFSGALRAGQPVAWYSGAISALPESLTWQPGGVGPVVPITLDAGGDVSEINAATAAAASNPLLSVVANPTVIISESSAAGIGLDQASVAGFGVDPSRIDQAEADRMAAVVASESDGVAIVDGSGLPSGSQVATESPSPTPTPSGWLLGGLGALVVGSSLVGLLLDRWQRRRELAVLEMQGATGWMLAGSAAIQVLLGTAMTLVPVAFGLWCAEGLVAVSPGMLGTSTLFVAWRPVLWLALVGPPVAAALAWWVVILLRSRADARAPRVPSERVDREMISA